MKLNDFYEGKKVFITGHTGFKGSWMTKILVNMGAEVTGYSDIVEELSLYKITRVDSKLNSICGDIRNLDDLKNAIKKSEPEIVIHMSAQALVRSSYENPVYTYETNVMGTVNILEAVREIESIKSVVNVTTDKVYENKEWEWGYREDDVLCGKDPYSNSKSCSELVTSGYRQSFFSLLTSPSISTARSGNVIGGGDFSKDRIIPDCIKSAANNEEIAVRNPHSTRPYQHVLDCIYGYLLLAAIQYENKDIEGCYNFGPSDSSIISTGELVDIFCRLWGNNQKWKNISCDGPREANFLKLDSSKSKTHLGWNPKWDIETAVLKTIEWSKACILEHDENKANEIMDKQIREYFDID